MGRMGGGIDRIREQQIKTCDVVDTSTLTPRNRVILPGQLVIHSRRVHRSRLATENTPDRLEHWTGQILSPAHA
jgi:hypothetical protein